LWQIVSKVLQILCATTGTSGYGQDFHHLLYMCKEILYSFGMIESFMHKGLEDLFEKGKSAKVQAYRDDWMPSIQRRHLNPLISLVLIFIRCMASRSVTAST